MGLLPSLDRSTVNGTIIEPILMIFERCICLVIRWILDYLTKPDAKTF